MAKPLSDEMRAWVEANQGKQVCACGCGELIQVKRDHHSKGIPRYLPNHRARQTAEERFWPRVEKRGDCWEWTGHRTRTGYGMFWVGRTMVSSHRFSWELHNGPIPGGLHCLHRCDNPACVYPVHLYLGSHQDNMDDKRSRGRQVRGERSRRAKLTDAAVRSLRQEYANGLSQQKLARRYGVASSTVCRTINGKLWKHVQADG